MRSARPALFVLAVLTLLALSLVAPATAIPVAAQASKGKSSVSVLTFNVCGNAAGCRNWDKRESAVVKRIVASKADVVNVQETWGVLALLEQRLAAHGYAKVADSGNEGMFAKTSKIAPVTAPTNVTTCTYGTIYLDPSVDTSQWDPTDPHKDESGVTWYPNYGVWSRNGKTCADSVVQAPKVGEVQLNSIRGRAGAAWAMLRVKKTGKTYLFVSSHLSTGKNNVAGKRSKEVRNLLSVTKVAAEGRPRVFAGDFNSSIQRGKDTVGKRMKSTGFTDAYTQTKNHKGAKYNSATGYGKKPNVGGSHIDRVFVPRGGTATQWEAVVKVRGGKSVEPIPSDHSAVRVSLVLP